MPSFPSHSSRPDRVRYSRRHIILAALLVFAFLGFAATQLLSERAIVLPFQAILTADNPDRPLKLADADAKLNILFIGNSLTYSNDLPGMLEALIDSTDFGRVHIETLTRGGYGLEDHWGLTNAPMVIAKGGWDIVVIQQGPSATEGRPSLLEYSKIINAAVTKQEGRTALYQVWPDGSRYFDYDGVCESYRMAAEQIEGLLFPVGEAFRMARNRDETLSLYRGDNFHPNPNGTYLAALVMFQQVTGRSPVGLPVKLKTSRKKIVRINPETAIMLQEVAAEASEKFGLQ